MKFYKKTPFKILYSVLSWNKRILKVSRIANRLLPRQPTLIIASMPKSGSTFLCAALAEATGYRRVFLGEHFMSTQDLNEAAVLDNLSTPCVVHQHFEANQPNLLLMQRYKLRAVFQYRRIDDIFVSILDKLNSDPWLTPSLAAGKEFLALPKSDQLDQAIALIGPRFLQLYAGWWTALQKGWVDGYMISYEEMVQDKAGAVSSLLDFFNAPRSASQIEDAIGRVEGASGTRRNVGVTGRGVSYFEDKHYRALAEMAAPFGWVDFRPIGLDIAPSQQDFLFQAPTDTDV